MGLGEQVDFFADHTAVLAVKKIRNLLVPAVFEQKLCVPCHAVDIYKSWLERSPLFTNWARQARQYML